MEEGLKNEVIRLINLKKTTKNDVQSMTNIIREHIDKRMSICSHCVAQIRFAQRQLLNWYNAQETTEEIKLPEPPPIKVGCQSCKQKTTQTKKGVVINTPNKKK
jgi:hypothetical protein